MTEALVTDLRNYVQDHAGSLIQLLRDLVAIPSENCAPLGFEGEVQRYIAARLQTAGCDPQVYTPEEVPGIHHHPAFWPGRDYTGRPNVNARISGSGGGRSLILSGHADTVPAGTGHWTVDPFGGHIEANRLYGRGANDMKSGIAMNLFVVEALHELGIRLKGDLIFESVVDEEFGGVNGTLAARLMGFHADAAVLAESSALRICSAQRGGRMVHLTLRSPNHGILSKSPASAMEQLRVLLNEVSEFQRQRLNRVRVHPLYQHLDNPVPASVTRVVSAPWGTAEPPNIPSECRVEMFWEAMPGETQHDIDHEFHQWLEGLLAAHPDTFSTRPVVEFPIRWLPGSALDAGHELIGTLSSTACEQGIPAPPVQGIEGPCDLYLFHQMGIPAVLWGPRGGNTHNPDEYVEIDSLIQAASVLLSFTCRWCGVRGEG